ncbi:MAG: Crp/Fnr family transcriptional regulator [Lawsonibacter sp.]
MELLPHNETDFPAHIWRPFAEHRAPIRCSPGFLIYLQGTEATCFYYLKEGRVKSFMQSEDGAERVLNVYEAGSLFGEASFLDELPRVSSAVALTPCQLVPIDRELVTQEIAKDPGMALAIMKYLARTVRLLSSQVDQMAFRPAVWRVAKYLLSLSSADGRVPSTQDDIAASVSVSRVTVSRILNDLARKGWVELGYRCIRLIDRTSLESLCQD